MAKIKTGELRVTMEEEEAIWCDRKRKTIFALPWSFTKYTLTPSRLFIKTGFFRVEENELRLYRVTDVTYTQTFWERIAHTGTLRVLSSDASTPNVQLLHIKNAKKVKDVLSQCVEQARRQNGVRTSELVGNGGPHFGGPEGHDLHHEHGDALGPEMIPDANHDGIDDRLQ